ncbi:hypothetical protein BD770DRAFT_406825 [Pilaira anomala]|nr:hypothetical protein BD770DRAFT_406825 [Pilaira anomala]
MPGCYYSRKTKNLLIQFEEILENIHLSNEKLVSTQQTRYIEAFMLVYSTYMNELLTLNQMVTEDEVQEAITLEDEIISTQYIYNSLCNSMWNNLAKNTSAIQVCQDHNENGKYLFRRETLMFYNKL